MRDKLWYILHTRSKGQKSVTITEVGDPMKHQNALLGQLALFIIVVTLLALHHKQCAYPDRTTDRTKSASRYRILTVAR